MNAYELMEGGFTDEDLEGFSGCGESNTEEDAIVLPLDSDIDEYYDMYYPKDEIETDLEFDDTESLVGPSEHHEAHARRNTGWRCSTPQKVDLEKILVITIFVLELPSAVFDQLSSVHKPQYALMSMLMSFAAMVMCIIELVYKARREKVTWKWRNTLPWLYYPPQIQKPFGNFKDIIGLVCAICQCIVTTIGFHFARWHADNPIKISVWPIVFAFGLLCSKFLEKLERRNV